MLVAIVVAAAARSRRTLTEGGAITAVFVAAACSAAGWIWPVLLFLFFISGTLLSQLEKDSKQERTRAVIEKGGERDALQVVANGGVFALFAVASVLVPSSVWLVLGTGAIAAATADTWATEIGSLSNRGPRSVITWNRVPVGTSGGVTVAGLLASLGGATMIALVTILTTGPACAAIAGGIGGSLLDSMLGATVQGRRWCEQCGAGTERQIHVCGTRTVPAGGIGWMNNDAVNALSSLGGAAIGGLCLL